MTNNELKHYGILGQKWGVRRFENEDGTLTEEGKLRYYGTAGKDIKVTLKDVRHETNKLAKGFSNKDPRREKIKKLKDEAYSLAERYHFDGDDGGGGSTKADQKAGKKYMELWDEIEYLEQEIRKDSYAKGKEIIKKKYGEVRINNLEKAYRAKGYAILAAIYAAGGIWLYTTAKNAPSINITGLRIKE